MRQQTFLDAYEKFGRVDYASQIAGISPKLHYSWMSTDPEYRPRFEESERLGVRALQDEAKRRAFDSSDRLLEFLLKGLDPATFGDRFKAEMSGPNGGPIQIQAQQLEALSDEELAQARALQLKVRGA